MTTAPDGALIDGGGVVVCVVYGWGGQPPEGQSFIEIDPSTAVVGQTIDTHAADAQTALQTNLARGIAVSCASNAALSATYSLDDVTMGEVGAVARDFAAGLGLPGGAPTFSYPDITGTPRAFTGVQIMALYRAQRDLIFALTVQAAVMKAGGTAVWPANTATIA